MLTKCQVIAYIFHLKKNCQKNVEKRLNISLNCLHVLSNNTFSLSIGFNGGIKGLFLLATDEFRFIFVTLADEQTIGHIRILGIGLKLACN